MIVPIFLSKLTKLSFVSVSFSDMLWQCTEGKKYAAVVIIGVGCGCLWWKVGHFSFVNCWFEEQDVVAMHLCRKFVCPEFIFKCWCFWYLWHISHDQCCIWMFIKSCKISELFSLGFSFKCLEICWNGDFWLFGLLWFLSGLINLSNIEYN